MLVDPPYGSKGAAGVQASYLRNGHLSTMLPGGHWQCVIWNPEGTDDWELYVRWQGEQLTEMPEGIRPAKAVVWQDPPLESLLSVRERKLLPLLEVPGEWQQVAQLGTKRSALSTASLLRKERHAFGSEGHWFEARMARSPEGEPIVEGRYLGDPWPRAGA